MNFRKSVCTPFRDVLAATLLFMSPLTLRGQTLAPAPQVPAAGARSLSAGFLRSPALAMSDAPSGAVSADLDGDGKPDLIVASQTTGRISVYLGRGAGKFAPPSVYRVGGHPVAILAVDVDGDGTKDVVTANGADGTVSVMLTIAGGKLGPSRTYTVGFDADLLANGDLNGDAHQDLAVLGKKTGSMAILLNDVHGEFHATGARSIEGTPAALTMCDLDGDHQVDVAIANVDGTLTLLRGANDGTFITMKSIKASSSGSLSSVASGDFNQDGFSDLAVTEPDTRSVRILLGNGDGTFSSESSYTVGSGPLSVMAADVDGDGHLDLLAVNQGSNTISVLMGVAGGIFKDASNLTVGDGPTSVAIADFDGSGHVGLAVVNASAQTLALVTGNGDGSFRAAPSYSGGLSPRAIASGDLNGDGLQDLVVANFCGSDRDCTQAGSLSVYLGQAKGGYQLGSTQAIGMGPVAIALADVNGDGLLDAIALNRGDKSISVLLGAGDGTLQQATTLALSASPVAFVVKDLNKDGKQDLAIVSDCGSAACSQPGTVDTYLGSGDATFRLSTSTPVRYDPSSIAAGDLNGDGIVDLVVANACGNDPSCKSAGSASILLGTAQESFEPQPPIALSNMPSSIALRTPGALAAPDLVATDASSHTVSVLTANGDATFKAPVNYTVGNAPRSLVITDLNGDGLPDVAVANAKDSTVTLLYGQADGSLAAGESYPVAAGPEALTAVAAAPGRLPSLATANGNVSSSVVGNQITSLTSATPNAGSTPTTTTLAVLTNNPTVNQAVTLQATVLPLPLDGETVTFSSDDIGTLTCTSPATTTTGVALCTTSQLTAGSRSLTANYPGNNDLAASSDNQPLTVTPLAATLSLAGPSGAISVNQAATFTASLALQSGSFTPTAPSGTISFTVNGSAIADCPAVTLTAGAISATCTTSTLLPSSASIQATYGGSDTNYNVSGSPASLTQTVNPVSATLNLTGPAATPVVNQQATFTASLALPSGSFTPTAPSGTISFTVNGAAIADCPSVTLTAGAISATCSTSTLVAPSDTIVATYGGNDSNYNVSGTPATVTQTVNPAAATLSLTGPSAALTVNQPATFTASLVLASGSFAPTAPVGTISFTLNGTALNECPSVTLAAGSTSATCTTSRLVAPSDVVGATYGGTDPNYTVATSASITQTVAPVAASLALVGPQSAVSVNQSATFTATLSVSSGSLSPIAPAGTIAFTLNGLSIAECPGISLAGGGVSASCTTSRLMGPNSTIRATYSADPNYLVAAGPVTLVQNVNPLPTTLTLAPPPSTTVNSLVTFTATLNANATSPTPASGTIAFTVRGDSTICPTVTLVSGSLTASCTTANLIYPSDVVTATYSGDNNYTGSTAAPVTIIVNKLGAATVVTSDFTSVVVNQPVTFTANVQGVTPGPVIPAGNVTFRQGGIVVCSAVALNPATTTSSAATCQTAFATVSPGGYTVMATYSGDNNFNAATTASSASPVTVAPSTPIVALASNPSMAVVDQPVTFTAVLSQPYTGSSVPTGTVVFLDQTSAPATTLCQATVNSGGSASCNAPFLAQGARSVVASFTPTAPAGQSNPNFNSASSPVLVESVSPVPTQIRLASSISNPPVNSAVTLSATLTTTFTGSVLPQGTVTYSDGGTTIPSCTLAVTNGVVPNCTATFASSGAHSIRVVYSSDPNFATSSDTLALVVGPAATTTQIAVSSSTLTVGQTVTLTATVTAQLAGLVVPQGRVTFADTLGNTLCATSSLVGGTASCSASFLTQGNRSISATFGPSDGNFSQSTSAYIPVSVSSATTSLQIRLSTTTPVVDQPVVLTATLAPQFPGNTTPQGRIAFTDSATSVTLCTANLDAAGNPSACQPYSFLAPGPRNVTAVFTPSDANFLTSNTASVPVTVSKATTTLAVLSISATAAPASPLSVNEPLIFSAQVRPAYSAIGLTTPTGTVVFSSASATVCTAMNIDTNGVASCAAALGAAGTYTITATYSGDGSFLASPVSAPFVQAVAPGQTQLGLISSLPIASATRSVTYTATLNLVAPAVVGAIPVAGTISFSSNGIGTLGPNCTQSASPVVPGSAYLCTITYPVGTVTPFPVNATYNPAGGNFAASSNSVSQTVQDFTLQFVSGAPSSVQPFSGPLNVTQAYTSVSDPFTPVASLAVLTAPISTSGFADGLSYRCTLPATVVGLTCAVSPGTAPTSQAVVFSASTSATPGTYVATITASDTVTTALARSTTLMVRVGSSVPTSLSPGVTGTVNVPFAVASPQDTFNFACPQVLLVTAAAPQGLPTTLLKCMPSSPSGTLTSGSFSFVLSPNTQTSMVTPPVRQGDERSSRIFAATFLCVPFLALAGSLRRKDSGLKSIVRFLASIILLAGVAQTIGCGGGFITPPKAAASTTGNYLVQVTATDTQGTKPVYYAVIPVAVQ